MNGMQTARLVLASGSPRRRELLDQIGAHYQVMVADVDESVLEQEMPAAYVQRLATLKAIQVSRVVEFEAVVLGADTAVVMDQVILGKPETPAHAEEMLNLLSGQTHQVYSAVSVVMPDQTVHQCMSVSDVTFSTLSTRWIREYCATTEPLDKAGAYAIQGCGGVFVERIEGSYSGVVGLPVFETARLLRRAGLEILT